MRDPDITKMDAKGRLLIPAHVRKLLNIKEGSKIAIVPEGEEIRIMPLER